MVTFLDGPGKEFYNKAKQLMLSDVNIALEI